MDEQKETEETGKSGLDTFATVSMRGPRRGIYQQLLAQLLVKANKTNDPLIKISTICECAFTSRQKDKLDMDLVDVAYSVCTSFQNTIIEDKEAVRIPWSFPLTQENWKRFVAPWNKRGVTYFPLQTPLRDNKYPERRMYVNVNLRDPMEYLEYLNEEQELQYKLYDTVTEEIGQMPFHQAFFEQTAAISKHSFYVLRGEFSRWALQRLLEAQATIAEEIDPQVWKETLELTRREEEEE